MHISPRINSLPSCTLNTSRLIVYALYACSAYHIAAAIDALLKHRPISICITMIKMLPGPRVTYFDLTDKSYMYPIYHDSQMQSKAY